MGFLLYFYEKQKKVSPYTIVPTSYLFGGNRRTFSFISNLEKFVCKFSLQWAPRVLTKGFEKNCTVETKVMALQCF